MTFTVTCYVRVIAYLGLKKELSLMYEVMDIV